MKSFITPRRAAMLLDVGHNYLYALMDALSISQ